VSDGERIERVRRILRGDATFSRLGGVVLLALAIGWAVKGAGSIHETEDGVIYAVVLAILAIPALLLLRSGFRRLEGHPLLLALTRHPERITTVRIVYVDHGGAYSSRIDVRLAGGEDVLLTPAEGEEQGLAEWMRTRSQAAAQAS